MPKYSIVIPTRQRHDTLHHSLRATLAIDHDDFEVIVQDNCSDERTRQTVEAFDDPRVIYRRSDVVLSMSDNWEAALESVSGDYVTYVGDDDALTLDACRMCDYFIEQTGTQLVYWKPSNYWWPNALIESKRNWLFAKFCRDPLGYRINSARRILLDYYCFKLQYADMPIIYNAFVSRQIIEQVRKKGGSYFSRSVPDIYSGIANCAAVDEVLCCNSALSVRGASGHSNGVAHVYSRVGGKELREQYAAENLKQGRFTHPTLSDTLVNSIILSQANVMACAKDDLFADDDGVKVDILLTLKFMMGEMTSPDAEYDELYAAIKDIAAKHDIDIARIGPPPQRKERSSEPSISAGPYQSPNTGDVSFAIHGDMGNFSDVYGAVCLIDAMSAKVMPK